MSLDGFLNEFLLDANGLTIEFRLILIRIPIRLHMITNRCLYDFLLLLFAPYH